jgi:hypothetical protein
VEEEKGRKSTRVEGDNEVLGGSGDYNCMGEEEKNGREHTTMEGGWTEQQSQRRCRGSMKG